MTTPARKPTLAGTPCCPGAPAKLPLYSKPGALSEVARLTALENQIAQITRRLDSIEAATNPTRKETSRP